MEKLETYICKNRRGTQKVKIEYAWHGEMFSNTRALFYDVPTKDEDRKVFAFISYPETKRPKNGYPAVLLIHGGNGTAFYEMSKLWSERGYVVIAPDYNNHYAKDINLRIIENEKVNIRGYGSFNDYNTENPWAYFSCLSSMRAIDILYSDESVDKSKIYSCGVSWGGVVNLLLLSQEKRINAGSIIYSSAFLSDSEWAHTKKVCGDFSEKEWEEYNEYIDPKNYIKKISCPVFFTAGTDDVAFTMENRRKTTELIDADKYFGYRLAFPHGNFIGFEQIETDLFFKNFERKDKRLKVIFKKVKNRIFVKGKGDYFIVETNEESNKKDILIWTKTKFKRSTVIKNDTKTFFIVREYKGTKFSSDIYVI